MRRLLATGPNTIWARMQPYRVVINATLIWAPILLEPSVGSMVFSMLIKPIRVPTMPNAGETAEALSYMAAAALCRSDMHSMSFSRVARTRSGSLASTISMIACLKKGSSCSLAFSSRASRPSLRAIWARSTSWSMMYSGFCFTFFSITAKCFGMLRNVFSGKLASTMAMEQPMVIMTLAPSIKLPSCDQV